nr:hypothetical protein [Tanacetum cinerariifolium]
MYTTVSSPYEGRSGDVSPRVDGPSVMPKDPYAYVVAAFQALPPPDYVPGPKEPEQAPPSPSPGYIPESDLDEDPEEDDDKDTKEDPADYPTDHNDEEDEEEEPSRDDADEEDEEQDEDDDDEEEEHPSSADSIPPSPALRRLSIVHCLVYEAGESSVAAAARLIKGHSVDYGFVDSVEAKIRRRRAEDIGYGNRDTWIDPRDVAEEEGLTTLEGGHLVTALGEIRVLQVREQARAGAPEGASSST